MAEDERNQGLRGAHTAADCGAAGGGKAGAARLDVDPERAAKVGAVRATAEAAMAGLAERLASAQPEAEQPSLLFDPDEPMALFAGPVRHVAEKRDAAKRARGRPAGSQNRRSDDLRNYLLSMGYRDPALILADIANADPLDLAAELSTPYRPEKGPHAGQLVENSITPDVALKLIKDAAAELMPYFHAKRPQEANVNHRMLGVMFVGEMPAAKVDDDGTMDLTRVPAPE